MARSGSHAADGGVFEHRATKYCNTYVCSCRTKTRPNRRSLPKPAHVSQHFVSADDPEVDVVEGDRRTQVAESVRDGRRERRRSRPWHPRRPADQHDRPPGPHRRSQSEDVQGRVCKYPTLRHQTV
jgi:hypothetical protein